MLKKTLVFITIALLAVGALVGCTSSNEGTANTGDAAEKVVLKVGATEVPHAEILREVVAPILAEEGIELDVVTFTDYALPNPATDDGELDANFFQHIPYLNKYNEENNSNLTVLAKVHIEPMRIYSSRHATLEDLPEGAVIGIPNDPTNGGRALLLLQSAGLIKLDPDAGITAVPRDVIENQKNLRFRELNAELLPRVLNDLDAAAINVNFALEANLPEDQILFTENADSPYVNVLVAKAERKDDPALQKLAEALTSPAVEEFILERYNGAVVPAFGK